MAKVRKNMCIKIYKIIKKIRPEIHSDLIKKMIVYYEYKIRNSISDKIYSCKIKELFETIKERLYDKNKKNENLKGTLKFNDLNLDYIEINSNKYNDYFGAICIPKNI